MYLFDGGGVCKGMCAREIIHILMNGMMGFGDLSTRKVINLLRHGLERCIVCLVNQSDSVPDRAGEFKHQITLTKLDRRSRKTRYL